MLRVVEDFLAHPHEPLAQTPALATALTVRSNAPTADRDLLLRIFDRELHYYRGRPIASPEHYVAVFEGPGRAVECALSVLSIAHQSRIDARAGVQKTLREGLSDARSHAGDHGSLVLERSVHNV